ncbi:MAG: rod-binding protein [Magnetococcales bacterium]|nr:rod-binding protein [Magnetococcales bacterium]
MSQAVGLDPKLPPVHKPRQTTLTPHDEQRLRGAAADFEALFVKQMLSAMRKTIPKDESGEGLIRESQGEKIFRDMLDTEYATAMSRRGGKGQAGSGIGLGDMIFKQLVKRYQIQSTQPIAQSDPTVDAAQKGLVKLQSETNAMQATGFGPKSALK